MSRPVAGIANVNGSYTPICPSAVELEEREYQLAADRHGAWMGDNTSKVTEGSISNAWAEIKEGIVHKHGIGLPMLGEAALGYVMTLMVAEGLTVQENPDNTTVAELAVTQICVNTLGGGASEPSCSQRLGEANPVLASGASSDHASA